MTAFSAGRSTTWEWIARLPEDSGQKVDAGLTWNAGHEDDS